MQIPPIGQFRADHDRSDRRQPARLFASIEGTEYDLFLPWGRDDEPDADSLAFAPAVLAALDQILDEAIGYVGRYVDMERKGVAHSRPYVTAVYCDALSARVEVDFTWEMQMYTRWTVAFHWDGSGRRTPIELKVRPC